MKYLFIISVLFFLLLNCSKSTDPVTKLTNFRELTWTIDTLSSGTSQNTMMTIWGSSAHDVYVAGHNSGDGVMWHFNGNRWDMVDIRRNISGIIDLSGEIWGNAPDRIWSVGTQFYVNPNPEPNFFDSSLIIVYDGVEWRKEPIKKQRWLFCIGGQYPDHVWSGGRKNSLYRFRDNSWTRDSLIHPRYTDSRYTFNIADIKGDARNGFYLTALYYMNDNENTYLLFKQVNDQWILQDSTYSRTTRIDVSPTGTLYGCGNNIRTWSGSSWEPHLLGDKTIYSIYGTCDDNILAVGFDWDNGGLPSLFHYNGSDWYSIPGLDPGDVRYEDVWTDGREVFVVGWTYDFPQKTIIAHGK